MILHCRKQGEEHDALTLECGNVQVESKMKERS